MCNNQRWINPWEDPETSPWRNYWGNEFWEKNVLCNGHHSDRGRDRDRVCVSFEGDRVCVSFDRDRDHDCDCD